MYTAILLNQYKVSIVGTSCHMAMKKYLKKRKVIYSLCVGLNRCNEQALVDDDDDDHYQTDSNINFIYLKNKYYSHFVYIYTSQINLTYIFYD